MQQALQSVYLLNNLMQQAGKEKIDFMSVLLA